MVPEQLRNKVVSENHDAPFSGHFSAKYDSHVILLCYFRTPVDYRDYNKITEQDCNQVVTHYGRNKFGRLFDVAIASTGEAVIVDYDKRCVVVLDDKLNLLKLIGQGSDDSFIGRMYNWYLALLNNKNYYNPPLASHPPPSPLHPI